MARVLVVSGVSGVGGPGNPVMAVRVRRVLGRLAASGEFRVFGIARLLGRPIVVPMRRMYAAVRRVVMRPVMIRTAIIRTAGNRRTHLVAGGVTLRGAGMHVVPRAAMAGMMLPGLATPMMPGVLVPDAPVGHLSVRVGARGSVPRSAAVPSMMRVRIIH